jgi:hypothetical protein
MWKGLVSPTKGPLAQKKAQPQPSTWAHQASHTLEPLPLPVHALNGNEQCEEDIYKDLPNSSIKDVHRMKIDGDFCEPREPKMTAFWNPLGNEITHLSIFLNSNLLT